MFEGGAQNMSVYYPNHNLVVLDARIPTQPAASCHLSMTEFKSINLPTKPCKILRNEDLCEEIQHSLSTYSQFEAHHRPKY